MCVHIMYKMRRTDTVFAICSHYMLPNDPESDADNVASLYNIQVSSHPGISLSGASIQLL